jgi:hypothetical protein
MTEPGSTDGLFTAPSVGFDAGLLSVFVGAGFDVRAFLAGGLGFPLSGELSMS